ncbi:hypothetical protein Droror1_Dr00024510 [Drosera rotundifolia]
MTTMEGMDPMVSELVLSPNRSRGEMNSGTTKGISTGKEVKDIGVDNLNAGEMSGENEEVRRKCKDDC